MDVFFSGGEAEEPKAGAEDAKPARSARTDPAASMQSSRRRKAKNGSSTKVAAGESTTNKADSSKETSKATTSKTTTSKSSTAESAGGKSRSSKAATGQSTTSKSSGTKSKTGTDGTESKKRPATGSALNAASSETAADKATAGETVAENAMTAEAAAGETVKTSSGAATSPEVSDSSISAPESDRTDSTDEGGTASRKDASEPGVESPVADTAVESGDGDGKPGESDEPATTSAREADFDAEVLETHPGVYRSASEAPTHAATENRGGTTEVVPPADSTDDVSDLGSASADPADGVAAAADGVADAAVASSRIESSRGSAVDTEVTGDATNPVSSESTELGSDSSLQSSEDSSDDGDDDDGHGDDGEDADGDDDGVASIADTEYGEVDVELIDPNPRQPRTVFDEDQLAELVHSIREIGVLQPVVVRQKPGESPRYELIMGERRLRATKEAGLATIPAIIRHVDDTDLLRDALLENLHRAELNPLEEAAAYGQLLEDFGCTQEELSERIGRSRPQISNTLRLLRLPPLVQRRVAAGVISAGHARAILGLKNPEHMEVLAQRIVAEGMSVRASEEAVVLLNRGDAVNVSRGTSRVAPEFIEVAERLGDRLETKVNITVGKRKGKLSVEFANQEDLDRILSILGIDHSER
ncbi:ParB/RepB/Spo0J family partition protein [Brevibacterium sp.]|uniref:ParB/RepB/Spo0J family partition protein n=1 Tax=Brevibacterium sp. TaxID=1701 RepID=UPI002810B356|nr:ParB/RepB/Spo0J family partition protein [Brevibacterium sp.]